MKSTSEVRAEWLKQLLSTAPAVRPRAEAAVKRLYGAAGFPEPRHFIWFDSPFKASWVVALLVAPHHQLWTQKLSGPSLSRADKEKLDRARATLGEQLGIADANAAVAAAGAPLGQHLQFPPVPTRMFTMKLVEARYGLSNDIMGTYKVYGDDDDLARAETYFWGSNKGALRSAIHCPTTDHLIGASFAEDCSFSRMADDVVLVGDREVPAIMSSSWEVAHSSGMWWPFQNVAIMSERPREVHVNEKYLLHRPDGPAVVYQDDWKVFAWNGKAVYEKWIMEPETVSPREYKGFDATFAQHVKSKAAPSGKAKKRAKPASILKTEFPTDHAARLEQLRAHAGGQLPLLDRYLAGAHQEVWRELVALGAGARDDAHAADALAVTYETMRRVAANVRTLVQRLTAIGYTFVNDPSKLETGGGGLFNMMSKVRDLLGANGQPKQEKRESRAHVPPPPDIFKRIVSFEKEFGTLPLSLRVFYEVVGEVNFIGRHPSIDPADGRVATDPLLVYGLDEGIVEFDEDEDGDSEGTAIAVTIAPDDLHKSNTSGGAAYEMAIPEVRADGELLNERHNLFFVDYLRLCFLYGGFPGYDGVDTVPPEIASLSEGLLEI